jgi:hypothetical protein
VTVGRPKVVSAKIRQKQAVLYCVENGDNSTTVLWLLGFGLTCALAQTAQPNLSPFTAAQLMLYCDWRACSQE